MGAGLLLAVTFTAVAALSVSANNINGQCQIYNGSRIKCSCIGNEEFFLPDEYNYANIVSVTVAGCDSADLHYSSLTEATDLEEMIVQNISGSLNFEVFITSTRIRTLRLSDIGRIPLITSDTFIRLASIDTLMIENAHIDRFEEDFSDINMTHFSMRNVTVERMGRLNLSENGKTLYIMNTELRNIATSLTFSNIGTIEIVGSKFRLQRPGLVSVLGGTVVVKDSVFSNASMNLNAAVATIRGVCADGKSALRLSSKYIDSTDNQLPNEIVYLTRDNQPARPDVNRNNTVCKAGNCKCPKISGQQPCSTACISLLVLGCLLTSFTLFRGFG
ncbi:PREDICTED: uncharacterized protein LOC106746635 [Dinoponera quadriceps]|uniref:Uncharacterized protein LOC106746635 n=1 Tax=Dinoponera quadriceps TaxID=609295 RepID=A0A6P3XKJ3_DINQU|nr:PREDICTED: uncharacterized protein LOC106746635 [Dinoponera quadriceps]XP_014478925.1 PREDICTED: uncharacterized protein LOC106746635 [Dinoponera quadriceps]